MGTTVSQKSFQFFNLMEHQDYLMSLSNMQTPLLSSQGFGFIMFVTQESPFQHARCVQCGSLRAHIEKCQIFGFQGTASLPPALSCLRTSRSATSCLFSSLLVPGGGSASSWGQLVSRAPRPFPRATSCAHLWPSCLLGFPASVNRDLLLVHVLLHPSTEWGTSLPGVPCKLRFPQEIWLCDSWLSKGRTSASLLQGLGRWGQPEGWDGARHRGGERQSGRDAALQPHRPAADPCGIVRIPYKGPWIHDLIFMCPLDPSSLNGDTHTLLQSPWELNEIWRQSTQPVSGTHKCSERNYICREPGVWGGLGKEEAALFFCSSLLYLTISAPHLTL